MRSFSRRHNSWTARSAASGPEVEGHEVVKILDIRQDDHAADIRDLFPLRIDSEWKEFHEGSFEDGVVFGEQLGHKRTASGRWTAHVMIRSYSGR